MQSAFEGRFDQGLKTRAHSVNKIHRFLMTVSGIDKLYQILFDLCDVIVIKIEFKSGTVMPARRKPNDPFGRLLVEEVVQVSTFLSPPAPGILGLSWALHLNPSRRTEETWLHTFDACR